MEQALAQLDVKILFDDFTYHANICTVMSHNIARPLTLRTSQSDYAIFYQIKSVLIFNIRLLLEREKQ